MSDWIALVISLAVAFGAAAIGGIATSKAITVWYKDLKKPSFTPPDWAFGPVWTILYLLMAVAAWLVWEQNGTGSVTIPLALYAVQLALNVLWSFIFFAKKKLRAGFIDIIVLWVTILATLLLFWSVSSLAGILMIPYLAWVSVASALNYKVWKLNPAG
jgi:benzodiazapine receptor